MTFPTCSAQPPRDEPRGPSGLKVEAAGDAIDVEYLAREMQSGDNEHQI